MARIFTLLSVIAVIFIILAGLATYWFSLPDIRKAKQDTSYAQANALSLSIASRLETTQFNLDGMASMPEVVSAFERGDQAALKRIAEHLQNLLPDAMKLRMLPANVSELDQAAIPHMGFADLEMVQATLKEKQTPVVQGEGDHRHLAFTSLVSSNDQAIGVLLASMKFGFLDSLLRSAEIKKGKFQVKQERTVLSSVGSAKVNEDDPTSIKIPKSSWEIVFWPDTRIGISELALIVSAIALCGLSASLAFFVGYRKLTEYLHQDQVTIIKATKDLFSGRIAGNYPLQLNEMKTVISTLAQYKRVLDQQEFIDPESGNNSGGIQIDDDFDTEFLDMPNMDGISNQDASTKPSSAVKLPQAEKAAAQTPVEPEIFEEPLPTAGNNTSVPMPAAGITPSSAPEDVVFRAYDIRGIVKKELTPDLVFKIGQALASEAKEQGVKTVVVGRDGRQSSSALASSLMQGIVTTGLDVLDIGMVPTPVLYFVSHHSEGRTGAMITGSHNPAEYNGIKMMLKGETLSGKKIQGLKQRIDNNDFASGATGSIEQNSLFTNEYIGIISEDIHIVRPMKVVLDCGNGAAGELAPVLLRTIGCEVIELFCDVDGSFPNHHPDPGKPENMRDLIAAVKQHEADVGIALDGDGDRIGVVDSEGKIIWPDRQLMLFAKDVLSGKPATEIIFDVKCSRHLPEQIAKFGGRPLMWKTGHSLIRAKLKETGAPLAGEMSGHIFFNDRWFGFDDGLYAATRLIELLSADTRSSSEVFRDFPDSVNTPELNVDLAEGENQQLLEKLSAAAQFPDANILSIDGLRIEFEDGWGLIRASNTTPSLVFRFEANDQSALKRIQGQFKQLLLDVKPGLSLPF